MHSRRQTWSAYGRLFDGSRRLLLGSVGLAIAQSVLLLPVALLVRRVFDTQLPQRDTAGVALSGALILVLYLGSAALGIFSRYSVLKVTKAAITHVRMQLLERAYGFSRAYLDRQSIDRLQSIIVHDSEQLDLVSNALVALLLPAAIVSLGLCAIALALNPLLFAALVLVVPVLVLLGRRLGRAVRERSAIWEGAFERFSSQTGLGLRAMTLTKVHGAERVELERRAAQVGELADAGREMIWRGAAWTGIQNAVAVAAGVVVLVIGGWATADGRMTLGDLLAFYAVVALLLRQLTVVLTNVPLVLAGYESLARLDEILAADDREPYSGSGTIDFGGSVAIDGVSFAYGSEPVLRDLSLELRAGERVAVVGPNGAGKSTLVSLILGLYRPGEGAISADGVPYAELDMPALRRQMGVVLQDPMVFPGSVAANIAYGRPEATREEIEQAARLAAAHGFVSALPGGYDTQVGDEGQLLSGGQRQRIAVARALLTRPALLILDEPTTFLDEAVMGELLANLAELPGSPALLLISHDSAVTALADRVYHLRGGRLATAMEAA